MWINNRFNGVVKPRVDILLCLMKVNSRKELLSPFLVGLRRYVRVAV
jgi:hypothetical protein